MRVFNLDGCAGGISVSCDGPIVQVFDLGQEPECDIQVYVPGPPGPPITDVGTFLAPVDISAGTIAAPVSREQRSFIQATTVPVDQPVIANPADNGPWLLALQVVGGNPITINDATNIKLSGQWIGSPDSILWLLWDGHSRYVEDHRNEI